MPSSYKVIKKINVNNEEERSVILTKISTNTKKKFLLDKSADNFAVDGNLDTEDIESMREKIYKQLHLEAEAESTKILEMIRVEAEEIKAQAKLHGRELGHKEGYEAGFKQGHEEGIQGAKDESEVIKENALDMIEQAKVKVEDYFSNNKTNIIELAAEMAESIIHSKIDSSSENILILIKPILQQYAKKGNITISCHPNNIERLKQQLYQLEEGYPDSKFIIFEDANLEVNGCKLENKTQIIDLQIKKQLDSIIEDIKEI